MIKISVIIPIYNGEKYLKKCIDSVLKQTMKDIEIIAVLNGCGDKSKEIVDSYKNKVRVIDLYTPSVGNARNEGVKAALGEYVLFFDCDDTMNVNMCESLYTYAKDNNLDVVNSDYYEYNESKNKKKYMHTYDHDICSIQENSKLFYLINYGPVKLFKKELIISTNSTFPTDLKYEDIVFVASMLINSQKIGKVPLPLYNYVIHEDSEQTTIDSRTFDLFKILDQVNEMCKNNIILKEDALCSLNVYNVTTFMLKQRNQKDDSLKNKFIEDGFNYLNKNFPNWKNCEYMIKQPIYKKIIKTNINLTKIACGIVKFWKK